MENSVDSNFEFFRIFPSTSWEDSYFSAVWQRFSLASACRLVRQPRRVSCDVSSEVDGRIGCLEIFM
jgi:hypothetical protein